MALSGAESREGCLEEGTWDVRSEREQYLRVTIVKGLQCQIEALEFDPQGSREPREP